MDTTTTTTILHPPIYDTTLSRRRDSRYSYHPKTTPTLTTFAPRRPSGRLGALPVEVILQIILYAVDDMDLSGRRTLFSLLCTSTQLRAICLRFSEIWTTRLTLTAPELLSQFVKRDPTHDGHCAFLAHWLANAGGGPLSITLRNLDMWEPPEGGYYENDQERADAADKLRRAATKIHAVFQTLAREGWIRDFSVDDRYNLYWAHMCDMVAYYPNLGRAASGRRLSTSMMMPPSTPTIRVQDVLRHVTMSIEGAYGWRNLVQDDTFNSFDDLTALASLTIHIDCEPERGSRRRRRRRRGVAAPVCGEGKARNLKPTVLNRIKTLKLAFGHRENYVLTYLEFPDLEELTMVCGRDPRDDLNELPFTLNPQYGHSTADLNLRSRALFRKYVRGCRKTLKSAVYIEDGEPLDLICCNS